MQRRQRHSSNLSKQDIDDEEAGVLGEIALAKLFALDPDCIIRSEGSGPVDFVLPGNLRVDIKASWQHELAKAKTKKNREGRLLVEKGKTGADIYIFAVIHVIDEKPDVEFKGWMRGFAVEFVKPTFEGRLGKLSHRVPIKLLQPMELLPVLMYDIQRVQQRMQDEQALATTETKREFDGTSYTMRWAVDRQSASIEVLGKRIGLVYAFFEDGQTVWADLYEPKANKRHKKLITAVAAALRRNKDMLAEPQSWGSRYE